MTALCADEYLILRTKGAVGWLNQLEPQFTTAEAAARGGRWVDECAHVFSFLPTCFRARVGTLEKAPADVELDYLNQRNIWAMQ